MVKTRWSPLWLFCVPAILHLLVPACGGAQELTVEEIVNRSAEAMGGSGHLEELKTIRFDIPLQDGPPLTIEIVRPNMERKERPGRSILVFDGHRAFWLEGPPREDGTLEGPRLTSEDEWFHFPIEIAVYFPAYFDYPAEYLGETLVDGSPAHLLQVTLPEDFLVVWAVDAESFLPVRREFPSLGVARSIGDFREVSGFLFPHSFWDPTDPSSPTVLEHLELNVELDPARFALPEGIG